MCEKCFSKYYTRTETKKTARTGKLNDREIPEYETVTEYCYAEIDNKYCPMCGYELNANKKTAQHSHVETVEREVL